MGEEKSEVHLLLPAQVVLRNRVQEVLALLILLKQFNTHEHVKELLWLPNRVHLASLSQFLTVQFSTLQLSENVEIDGSFDNLTSPHTEHDVLQMVDRCCLLYIIGNFLLGSGEHPQRGEFLDVLSKGHLWGVQEFEG